MRLRCSDSRRRSSTVETTIWKISMSSHTIQVEFTRVYSHCYSHHAPKAEILFGTGAGLSDATLGDSTYAVWGFLNATVMQFNITTFPWSFFMPSDTTYDGTSPSLDTALPSRVVVGCPVPRFLIVHHGICWPKRFLTVNPYSGSLLIEPIWRGLSEQIRLTVS